MSFGQLATSPSEFLPGTSYFLFLARPPPPPPQPTSCFPSPLRPSPLLPGTLNPTLTLAPLPQSSFGHLLCFIQTNKNDLRILTSHRPSVRLYRALTPRTAATVATDACSNLLGRVVFISASSALSLLFSASVLLSGSLFVSLPWQLIVQNLAGIVAAD